MCTKSLSDAIYHTVRLNKQAGRKPSTKYVLISFFFFLSQGAEVSFLAFCNIRAQEPENGRSLLCEGEIRA